MDIPFRDVNILLCVDFHQFSPVGDGLYCSTVLVVILEEQMQVVDPEWRDGETC